MTDEFEEIARLMMNYLCTNHHPHTTIIITPTSAEIVEGVRSVVTNEFVRD